MKVVYEVYIGLARVFMECSFRMKKFSSMREKERKRGRKILMREENWFREKNK